MKIYLWIIALFLCSTQLSFSQEGGVVSLDIPARNSLKFNRFIVNPTFSFVREQNKYISINNKREWVQLQDAPQTYLLSFSGRFRENIGLGIGVFQQNYGVLTTFGGILNFSYNAELSRDSNLTFGLNVGYHQSGINDGKVITNIPDPALENTASNSLITVSPAINYGTLFFDFGLSANNLVQYNFNSSELLEEDPQKSFQAHIMYTGYMGGRGFFDETKFSGLIKSDFKKDKTNITGIAMLTVPKGIWGQVGYSNQYGISGGIGLNITKQIAVEYNYEKAIGDMSVFGSSHDITLAYRFSNDNNYHYKGDDDEESLFSNDKKRNRVLAKPTLDKEAKAQLKEERAQVKADELEQRKLEAEARTQERTDAYEERRLATEARAKERAEEQERRTLEFQAKAKERAEAREKARLAAEEKLKANADERARLAAQAKADREAKAAEEAAAAEEARLAAQAKEEARLASLTAAQLKAEEDARLAAEAAAKAKADEEARLAAIEVEEDARLAAEEDKATELAKEEARLARIEIAKAKAEEEARLAAETAANEKAAAEAKAIEDAKQAAEAATQAKAAEDARLAFQQAAKAKAAEEARLAAQAAAKAKSDEEARLAAQAAAKAKADEEARLAAQAAAKAKADEEARLAAQAAAKAKSDEEARLAAQAAAKAKSDEEARLAAQAAAKAKSDEEARLAAQAAAKAKADEEARLAAQAAAKAKADEEARLAAQAAAKAKADEEARLAAQAAAKAKADEEARLAAQVAAKAKADEEARLAAQAAAKAKADEEARLAAQAAAEAKAAEDARLAAQAAAKAKADEEARLAAQAAAKAKADEEARLAAQAAAKAKADEEARLAAQAAAKAKADEESRLAAEAAAQAAAKAKAAEDARLAAQAAAKAKADEEARLAAEAAAKENVAQTDAISKTMFAVTEAAERSKTKQDELLSRLNDAVASKDKDLKDLKEENDLSEKGIVSAPKPFRSISAENRALEALKSDVDKAIDERNDKIQELENLYNERLKDVPNKNDATNKYYADTIKQLKADQQRSISAKASLLSQLDAIKIATEIERKRRIKRASYDNQKDRYLKDKAALDKIKADTPLAAAPLTPADFDFGDEQTSNVQILKGVQNTENGYYLVIAVHRSVAKRNEFLEKTVSAGESNVNFFFDINSSKYFIYHKKFNDVGSAMQALQSKGTKPYNGKMSVVKIEN